MQTLKEACWFHHETAAPHSTHVNLDSLSAFVERGRARQSSATLATGESVTSVSVKDASQGDVKGLPCGARSLLFDSNSGAIVCRGVNKFFDISEVSDAWMSDPSLWSEMYDVWAVRKMAGFIVTVFSLDGSNLELMSKHVLAGPHVDAARRLLRHLSDTQRAQMATDLFSWSACASFECIIRAEDNQHPVLECDVFDQQLVLIAVQQRQQLCEESMEYAQMPGVATKWGVRSAPAALLRDAAGLHELLTAAAAWRAVYASFESCPALAEGFVLLIETRAASSPDERPSVFPRLVRPLRLKLKTPRYVVLRAFRSLLFGDSRPQSYLYHQALLAWLHPKTPADIRRVVEGIGVCQLCDDFEAALHAQGRVRHRGAHDSVGGALAELQATSARATNPRHPCRLTVLVLCGLPGAGKSTVCRALIQRLTGPPAASPFGFVVHLSRDAVSRRVSLANGIHETSSKHKQRHLRAMVHHELCEDMRAVARLCVETEQTGVLLMDACNATLASRQVWRSCFPAVLDAYHVVYVDCADAAAIAQRAGHRDGHEVLHSAAEAQQALYTVRKKFQPPSTAEAAWQVDTSCSSAEEAAARVGERLARLDGSPRQHMAPPQATAQPPESPQTPSTRELTVAAVRAELQQRHTELLRSLLGVCDEVLEQRHGVASFLATGPRKSAHRMLQVRLRCTEEDLVRAAASVLSPTLGLTPTAQPTNTLASTGLRLVRRVTAALWGSAAAELSVPTGTVRRGHVKWLPGWLLHGAAPKALADVEAALGERFDNEPPAGAHPHVTLLHGSTQTAPTPSLTPRQAPS